MLAASEVWIGDKRAGKRVPRALSAAAALPAENTSMAPPLIHSASRVDPDNHGVDLLVKEETALIDTLAGLP